MINLKINNIPVQVEEGSTILQAAKKAGIKIPTLCYLKGINEIGACRVCIVEVKGMRNLVASCVYPASEGMEVFTNTPKVLKSRKTTVELLLSQHRQDCLSCVRNGNCELQTLSNELGCDAHRFNSVETEDIHDVSGIIIRDNSKCILCRRCVAVCEKVQTVGVIGANGRGFNTHIGTAFDKNLSTTECVNCGQCITACPTGALQERDNINEVLSAINDQSKTVIVGTAPSIRVALGEEFGIKMGENVEGKMVASLRRLGFDKVFDVNFTADLTIMEEGYEFINRVQNGGVLPMFTSCSPAWIKFCEHNFPTMLDHLSTCKSPQQMFGAVVKTYYAKKMNLDPKDIVVVSIMPCTAKKYEKGRQNQNASGYADIDYSLTTRELARLIKRQGILFNELEGEEFDNPLGIGSGAGLIFGATGGVMEAALRTVVEVLTDKPLDNLNFTEVRGTKGIKEASFDINGTTINVCVASGLGNARKIMQDVKDGKSKYHFVEIMSCPGGCVNGGGQPIKTAYERNNAKVSTTRAKAIYDTDANMQLRQSHKNKAVTILYDEFFEKPNSHIAHEILHTTYEPRKKY